MDKGRNDISGLPGADEPLTGIPGLGEQPAPAAEAAVSAAVAAQQPPQPSIVHPPASQRPSVPAGSHVGSWIQLVAATLLAALFALLALGSVIDAIEPPRGHHNARATYVVLAVICVGLIALCVKWALHVEHRLRRERGHPVALVFEGAPQQTARRSAAATRRSRVLAARRTRKYGPTSVGVAVAIWTLFFIGMVVAAIVLHANAARSDYVQHHGIPATAIVTNVDNIESCGRSSCTYHALISVRLAPPVDGVASTVVHYPRYSDLGAGDRVRVLVDPHELSYAEFAGSPSVTSAQWIILAGLAGFFAIIDLFSVRQLRRLLRTRREHMAAGAVASPAPAA